MNQKEFIDFLTHDMKRIGLYERRPTMEDWDALVQEGFFHPPPYYKNEIPVALKIWRKWRVHHSS
jgi:hypothetical protein